MMITDIDEIVRLKMMYADEVDGRFVDFAGFTLNYSLHMEPFRMPCTPKFGSKYITALVQETDYHYNMAIFYLEMDGKSYSIDRSEDMPYITGNQDTIKREWERMTAGEYYADIHTPSRRALC